MNKAAKTILLIDDDTDLTAATRAVLESNGYAVIEAHSGPEGLKMAFAHKPALIILDVMMASDTEGFDVSRSVKAAPELAGTPIILLTGIRRMMNLPFALEPDVAHLPVKIVLEKPVPPAKLLEEIGKLLA